MTDERGLEESIRLLRGARAPAAAGIEERIMQRVRAAPVPRRVRRAWQLPVGIGIAAGLLLVAGTLLRGRAQLASAPQSPEVVVQFEIDAPGAHSVALAGDFNGWSVTAEPLRLVPSARVWKTELRLPPGRFSYSFVIDGRRWVADPAAALTAPDDFGAPSSVLVVNTARHGE